MHSKQAIELTMEINQPLKLVMIDYVFCTSDYYKMWGSLQK
jgi:hypothetical protein